jgi:hypothetical protein
MAVTRDPWSRRVANTLGLWAFALARVPLLLLIRPRVWLLNDSECRLLIPLSLFSKNHVRSMYIAVLTAGADVTSGLLALHHVKKTHQPIVPIFKHLSAEFLRRPDGATLFTCRDGAAIGQLVTRAAQTGERVEKPVEVEVTLANDATHTPVARFTMTLSLKRRGK